MSMIAMPSSSCSSRIRSRICACVVTSSAVVGSSAISRLGWQDERHGDHGALAHAAAQLEGIGVDAPLGLGDADLSQHLDGLLRALRSLVTGMVQRDRLG